MRKDAWTLAIETLSWMEMQRLSERLAFVKTRQQLNLTDPNSMRYAYSLVVETTRTKNLIDRFINSVTYPKKIGEYNLGIQSFLRLYVYQTRVAKKWGKINLPEAVSIANLGRSILGWEVMREVELLLGTLLSRQLAPILEVAGEEERLSLETFHPSWFVKYCITLLGHDQAIEFLKGSIAPPPTYIRFNTIKDSKENIENRLYEEGVQVQSIPELAYTYKVLHTKKPLSVLPSFKAGLYYIQDKASCFAAQAADPKECSMVFDVCAAPGAKTTFLAQLMKNTGSIASVDFSKRRLKTWKKEVANMGVTIAEDVLADACNSLPFNVEADLLVLDPPCTSTGIFAKQPSSKWRLGPKSIEKMAGIQWQMINNCAKSVKAGGTLTYSTCSITVEENEMIIERFLKEHPEFQLVDIAPQMGLPGLRGLTKCQRLYPHIHQCNGFFIAKLQKQ